MMSRRPYWCSKQILWELDSSYVKNFSCSHKFAWMLATWENTLYTKNVKFERDLLTNNEEYMQSRLILQTFGLNCRIPCHLFACHWIRIASIVLCFVLQRTPTNENNGGTEWRGIQQLLLYVNILMRTARGARSLNLQVACVACT